MENQLEMIKKCLDTRSYKTLGKPVSNGPWGSLTHNVENKSISPSFHKWHQKNFGKVYKFIKING